ncbi:MAG: hypothetical protein KC417_17425, partial [Myxococcales bacterium]|nr:hypothetical protein [Myxococcales bacterium]
MRFAVVFGVVLAACASSGTTEDGDAWLVGGKGDSSIDAVVVNFRFKSEFDVPTSGSRMVENQIEEQLLYTVGQLNGDRSVSRLDLLEILDVTRTHVDGHVHVAYEARVPVAWGRPKSVPTTYDLVFPRSMSLAGQETFTAKYKGKCVEEGAHDVDVDSMWYDFRP